MLMKTDADMTPDNLPATDEGVPVSVKIRERIKAARQRFHSNDNIAEFIEPGELEKLLDEVEEKMQGVLDSMVIDTAGDHNANNTARRVAKMYLNEVFRGRYVAQPPITEFPNAEHLNELMIVGPLTVRSACSHHFCPVIGKIWIGVMPNEHTNVIGLSKYARLVDWIMGRPQIQEEAVVMLANELQDRVKPDGLAIVMDADHFCMHWRGVKDVEANMVLAVTETVPGIWWASTYGGGIIEYRTDANRSTGIQHQPAVSFSLSHDRTAALLRELERGGQSYYVHNCVESIEAAAEQLRGLLPDARITVGHGQMEDRKLERVMGEFVLGEVDILVCTTIIESGLDIPNANTIVVDRADKLGLAQLYQLRGRVGRSSRRAWCYLLYRQEDALSEVARKRLKAIFDAAHLGAGFQLALADLEIRGAGDLLGGEQSGHIAAVGFDLYSQLLAESVEVKRAEREGRPAVRKRSTAILDLPVTAHLPNSYVEDEGQRLDLYRRLGAAQSEKSIVSIADEMRDRFGEAPAPAQRLIEVAQLRADASDAGIASIVRDEGRLVIRFGDLPRGVAERVLADRPRGELSFQQGGLRSTVAASPERTWRLAVEIVGALAVEARRLEAAATSAAPLA